MREVREMKKLRIAMTKLLVKTVGKLSDGISISFRYGFTSGKMLDYVYRNKPSGRTFLGKLIDRIYLSHIGWRSIRIRKANLERELKKSIKRVLSRNGEASILDIASGPARYIIDTLSETGGARVKATCMDVDRRWIEEGGKKARELKLSNVNFKKGNAFDNACFGENPDIVVSSGFYDWITDNRKVLDSMEIIYRNMKHGGYFIFTNQCGHCDLEMVKEIFVDFNNNPLNMVTRSTQIMNSWAEKAGFRIIESVTDPWHYYSITLAYKERRKLPAGLDNPGQGCPGIRMAV